MDRLHSARRRVADPLLAESVVAQEAAPVALPRTALCTCDREASGRCNTVSNTCAGHLLWQGHSSGRGLGRGYRPTPTVVGEGGRTEGSRTSGQNLGGARAEAEGVLVKAVGHLVLGGGPLRQGTLRKQMSTVFAPGAVDHTRSTSPLLAAQHWRSSNAMSRTNATHRPRPCLPMAEARGLSGACR